MYSFITKIFSKDQIQKDKMMKTLKSEIQILMMIEHPNIVKFYEALQSKSQIYIVMELVKGNDLNKIIIRNE